MVPAADPFDVGQAAEEAGQFAADCQPQSGSSVLSAGARVCLLERLEDNALLLRRNADTGIGYLESHNRRGAVEDGMVFAPSSCGKRYIQMHAALFCELEGI